MNTVLNLFRREAGNGFCQQYDASLMRLQVHERDSWKGITPSTFNADYNPSPPILAAKFAKCAAQEHILAIANEDGKIAVQDTNLVNEEPGGERALEGHQCHYNAVFDIEWMPGEMKLVSASGDHTAQLWSLTESEMVSTQSFRGHSRSVKTVAFRRDDPAVFATGGRDGAIIIWDVRAQLGANMLPRADNCIYSGHAGGPGTPASHRKRTRQTPKIPAQGCSSSITGLVFQDDNTLISCGAGDGVVKVWDTRRHYTSHQRDPLPKHSFSYAGTTALKGFTNLTIDERRHRLYVNCMDNYIYCYNISTYDGNPLQRYGGFKNGTFYVKAALSPDGQYLISGSSDEQCYIWNVDNPKPLVKLLGHAAEVTSVAWMQNDRDVRIVTCSDDARHKVWRLGPADMDFDTQQQLRGSAEYCDSYRTEKVEKERLKSLAFTPRSVRGLVRRNETTPGTMDEPTRTPKTSGLATAGLPRGSAGGPERTKRTFTAMSQDGEEGATAANADRSQCPPVKRPYREECRGRRLFSPANSKSAFSFTALEIASSSSNSRSLNVILEASDEQAFGLSPCKSPLGTADLNTRPTDRDDRTLGGTSSCSLSLRCASPTLNINLPNFVIDGEAPHLVNVIAACGSLEESYGIAGSNGTGAGGSAKRKLKENIDWLTKIRKQKLQQAAKSIEHGNGTTLLDRSVLDGPIMEESVSLLLSPRLQQLKTCDDGGGGGADQQHHQTVNNATISVTNTPTTPRGRLSSRSSIDCTTLGTSQSASVLPTEPRRTPRSRRNSMSGVGPGLHPTTPESASIRRFLTVTTPTSRANAQATN
ncbi:protein lethal(2)denticleless [Anopheles ziemanni]|uniref:protein lethal(2)denticleless n=1 Tax=Anopheles coustani TaxID=139045 RepID=UPI002657FDD6|nr:protein lethal(2)denticleless [Anopheles coustani]XP_058178832.1 protein lethal(2)denticleless [Anopheles ziemanni]